MIKKVNKLHKFLRLIVTILNGYKGGKMFKLVSNYKPTGDQPQAIEYLVNRNKRGQKISDITWSYRFAEKLLQWQI